MSFELKEIYPCIYLATFDTLYDMGMTMVRVQEYYESPYFRGRYFALETYMDWWAETEGKDCFDYPAVWGGFNVPGYVIYEWHKQFHHEGIRDRERLLLDALLEARGNLENIKKTYLIAACSKSDEYETTVRHETAHAFYALHPKYKKSCKKLLAQMSPKVYAKAEKILLGGGYDKSVVADEIQAYSSSPHDSKRISVKPRKRFIANFDKFKNSIS